MQVDPVAVDLRRQAVEPLRERGSRLLWRDDVSKGTATHLRRMVAARHLLQCLAMPHLVLVTLRGVGRVAC